RAIPAALDRADRTCSSRRIARGRGALGAREDAAALRRPAGSGGAGAVRRFGVARVACATRRRAARIRAALPDGMGEEPFVLEARVAACGPDSDGVRARAA